MGIEPQPLNLILISQVIHYWAKPLDLFTSDFEAGS